jgi:hypothetical protein
MPPINNAPPQSPCGIGPHITVNRVRWFTELGGIHVAAQPAEQIMELACVSLAWASPISEENTQTGAGAAACQRHFPLQVCKTHPPLRQRACARRRRAI